MNVNLPAQDGEVVFDFSGQSYSATAVDT